MKRTDFKIHQNRQMERKQTDLWDVRQAGVKVTTIQGELAAQAMCDNLNIDPYYLDRNQTRFDRNGATKNVARTTF